MICMSKNSSDLDYYLDNVVYDGFGFDIVGFTAIATGGRDASPCCYCRTTCAGIETAKMPRAASLHGFAFASVSRREHACKAGCSRPASEQKYSRAARNSREWFYPARKNRRGGGTKPSRTRSIARMFERDSTTLPATVDTWISAKTGDCRSGSILFGK